MSPFFETVRVEKGTIHNRIWHNRRLNRTIYENFGIRTDYDIADYILPPKDSRLYRCKLLYAKEVDSVTLTPYRPRSYSMLKLVHANIDYPYKSTDRGAIEDLFKERGEADDIIIVRDGMLTDTSIANIALYDGVAWYTPENPLLEGTMRASLLAEKKLKTKILKPDDLKKSVKFAVMNAMTGFYQLKNIIFI
jgi:4-amino-4-deoxychorismate lyase